MRLGKHVLLGHGMLAALLVDYMIVSAFIECYISFFMKRDEVV